MSKITNNILNIVASVSLLLLVYSLYILRGIQPQGYKVNIYEQLPFSFYLTLLFCYLSACVLLLAYRKMSAVLILLLVNIIIIITPYMIGYISIGRGEEFSYIGNGGESGLSFISSLSHTGSIFVSILTSVSGMGTAAVSYFLPAFFSIIFITGMFLFYRVFMSREKLVSVAFLSSLVPYFGHFQVSTPPYYLSFCLVPLYLYVIRNAFSGKNREMGICLILMIPLIPLADPFIFAYLACYSVFLILSMRSLKSDLLHKIMNLNFISPDPLSFTGRKVPVFIFLSLTSGVFLLYTKYVSLSFNNIISTIMSTNTLITADLFQMHGPESNFFEFIHLFNLHYGKYYIPLIFISINSIIVWQNRKRFCHHFVRRYPRFLAMYIFTFFLELVFLFNPFIHYPPDRFANLSFIIFAQIPLLGYSLYVIFLRKGYTLGLGSAIMILCLLWTLGFFTCLNSPLIGSVSDGISQNEAQGIHWISGGTEDYPYLISSGEQNGINTAPEELGANSGQSADSQKYRPSYLIVTTFSEALSQNRQKSNEEQSLYVNNNKDNKLQKIYDSLDIEIYENRP